MRFTAFHVYDNDTDELLVPMGPVQLKDDDDSHHAWMQEMIFPSWPDRDLHIHVFVHEDGEWQKRCEYFHLSPCG